MVVKVHIQKNNHASSLLHFSPVKNLVQYVIEKKKLNWLDFLSSIDLLSKARHSSVKVDEKEHKMQETLKKEVIHSVKEIK